ncbi:helix-turn-helix domain-containing protein [Cellvibrio fibrivorans]|uniref:AraC-like DNA-binding protein n=1 Tax=Cellvibrio fibrivorans TaxID=126350 RepID=A0ABU1UUP6_9GAMM|nr:helix-turn-helix transcriptional regulator [Cellvibrio fibrivorans]MDR7088923.1 AraC-like DNA-binding protein [Cellvibrio fibrivorans]
MIETSVISHIDFFIRYACIGQLLLLVAYLFYKPYRSQSTFRAQIIPLMLALGVAAYLLLTAPYSPRPQGFIRSILLMFTHTMPVFLWLYGKQLFDDEFNLQRWPIFGKAALVLLACFYIYVFLIRGGGGYLQMASHVIALVFIVHLLASVMLTWRNDLVEQRRVARFWFVLLVGLFFLMLDLVELSNTRLNRHQIFMLMNASICLIGTSVTAGLIFFHELSIKPESVFISDPIPEAPRYSRLIPQENALAKKLHSFIEDEGYLQPDLTISKLAEQLECPDHHLRKLINQSLGYTNFNAFLNHYRIEAASKRLVETSLPVLTIALDIGFGSIASFNRAFKDIVGTTPTVYRTTAQQSNSPE